MDLCQSLRSFTLYAPGGKSVDDHDLGAIGVLFAS